MFQPFNPNTDNDSFVNPNLSNYLVAINNLANEFKHFFNNNNVNACLNSVKQMREHHGKAALIAFSHKQHVLQKKDRNEKDYMLISTLESLLSLMQKRIKECEIKIYQQKRANAEASILNSETDNISRANDILSEKTYSEELFGEKFKRKTLPDQIPHKVVAQILSGPNSERIHLENMTTESPKDLANETHFITETSTDPNYPQTTIGAYTKNINSSEAARLLSDMNQAPNYRVQNGGNIDSDNLNLPTLVYFWADWCGYSQKFNPTWKKFTEAVGQKFPNLRVKDLNVGKDDELNNVARKAGVKGYPTIVLFINGQSHQLMGSRLTVENILNFIEEKLKST